VALDLPVGMIPGQNHTTQEVEETMEKIKAFEESINTVWLPEQIEELTGIK
jgi:hypothetical protein